MLTPQEVSGRAFSKAAFGGYNMAMVDEFLDEVTDDYTALYKENAALKAKLKVLVDKVEELGVEPDKNQPLFICHANCPDYVAYVKELLKERFNVTDVRADFIGPVIGAHTGCGTLGLFFVGTKR